MSKKTNLWVMKLVALAEDLSGWEAMWRGLWGASNTWFLVLGGGFTAVCENYLSWRLWFMQNCVCMLCYNKL